MRGWFCALTLAGSLILGSCTTAKLEELRQISPQGTPFQVALAREYLAFSDSEATHYDWVDSYHFADKGLRAAYGQAVLPEDPADWEISSQALPELIAARADLLEALQDAEKVAAKPEVAARAQYFYDCWVEEQEEAWQPEETARCKNGFHSAMEDVNLTMREDEITEAPVARTTAYMVFFDHNQWALTAEGHRVLNKVIEDLNQLPGAEVLLHGHTDTSGMDDYNMSLSERRVKAVSRKLTDGGIPAAQITYFAFGETDLRVATADGIREAANRRVEIFLE